MLTNISVLSLMSSMIIVIFIGMGFRIARPMGLDPDVLRKNISSLVYTLLLPALVISVIWKSSIGKESFFISLGAAVTVTLSIAIAAIVYRYLNIDNRSKGAMILAAAFPNATYLGLPVLSSLYGENGKSIAIQYDLFACTPLLMVTAPLIAAKINGSGGDIAGNMIKIARMPPLSAAALAIFLGIYIQPVTIIVDSLEILGSAVIPLMLIVIGLSLDVKNISLQKIAISLPAIFVSLVLAPIIVYMFATSFELNNYLITAMTIEAAMPSMLLGIVLCEQYRLDSQLYAVAATVSTILAFFSIPLVIGAIS